MDALRTREAYQAEERDRLAPYACLSIESGGRVVPEPEHAHRTAFQRDRDRVVHSTAFRRLEYKTQVFVHHEGDHYRNRLTHTLEGTQIARSVARALRLNEDLAEAISLAHDLGHTPFGHAGERVLARLMRDHGGFDHNRQSLRTVDLLERRYPQFAGLNLCQETREGILKHGCHWSHPLPLPPLGPQRNAEAQVADVADEIAYTNHDLDDALRSGLVRLEETANLTLVRRALETAEKCCGPAVPEPVLRAQVIVALIDRLVRDLLEASAARLDESRPRSVDAIREAEERFVAFSAELERGKHELKAFLMERFYRHPLVLLKTRKAERVVDEIFGALCEDTALLPAGVRERFPEEGERRAVADYVAGMTDRFALALHRKLFDPHEELGI